MLNRRETDEFLADIAAEEPDAAAFLNIERPPDSEIPDWAGRYLVAWKALQSDRHFWESGHQSVIHFSAINAYALRYGIVGHEFEVLLRMLNELDSEWMSHLKDVLPKPDRE